MSRVIGWAALIACVFSVFAMVFKLGELYGMITAYDIVRNRP
jgi:hypothetical protein